MTSEIYQSYAGIGSRETPADVMALMGRVAARLEVLGWTLRSGAAQGADQAFEAGVSSKKEIFLPWKGFIRFARKTSAFRPVMNSANTEGVLTHS
jgi:hypothetical protein